MAADDELGPRAERAIDHALDLVGLRLRDQRAHVEVVGVGRVAPLDRLHLVGEGADELVVDGRAGDHAAGRRAVLAAVPVAGRLDDLGRQLDVGVVEHDHRGLAAQLEVQPLHRSRRDLRDVLAGHGVAGDRDHPDLRVADEEVADRGARARQHVEDALAAARPRRARRTAARTAACGRTA